MLFVSVLGGALISLAALGKFIPINETAIKLVMETAKFGTIFYLVHHVFKVFL